MIRYFFAVRDLHPLLLAGFAGARIATNFGCVLSVPISLIIPAGQNAASFNLSSLALGSALMRDTLGASSAEAAVSARSISASAIVVIALVFLYHLDVDSDRVDRHVTDALFLAAVSALFFAFKRFSERVLVFALLTAFCETWAMRGFGIRA